MVYSLYSGVAYKGKSFKASPTQLKNIDALVVDLQDIGTRSYTFTSAMKLAVEACFENGKEIIILDRPNPLGGLKVDGPPLDAQWMSYVGAFRVPYVHGLTMGELARMVRESHAPGGIDVTDAQRAAGKLTVITMRGWTRAMRWSETGLTLGAHLRRHPGFRRRAGLPHDRTRHLPRRLPQRRWHPTHLPRRLPQDHDPRSPRKRIPRLQPRRRAVSHHQRARTPRPANPPSASTPRSPTTTLGAPPSSASAS